MAKVAFVISLFYVLVSGVRAWFAVVAGDHNAVNAFNNTTMVAGIVMLISLYFIVTTPNNR